MMSVIMPGVSPPAESPVRAEARRLLGLPQSGALLLFVANDYARKGLDALLAALARLPESVTLIVVGNPAGIPAYQDNARSRGVAGRVRFLGAMHTFAMVVLEAMAHGLPVVASGPAHCGISAMLQDGQDALLLDDPRDDRGLAAVVSRVLDDPVLAAKLSEKGLSFAQGHTWEDAARRYERLYLQAG